MYWKTNPRWLPSVAPCSMGFIDGLTVSVNLVFFSQLAALIVRNGIGKFY